MFGHDGDYMHNAPLLKVRPVRGTAFTRWGWRPRGAMTRNTRLTGWRVCEHLIMSHPVLLDQDLNNMHVKHLLGFWHSEPFQGR